MVAGVVWGGAENRPPAPSGGVGLREGLGLGGDMEDGHQPPRGGQSSARGATSPQGTHFQEVRLDAPGRTLRWTVGAQPTWGPSGDEARGLAERWPLLLAAGLHAAHCHGAPGTACLDRT